MNILDSNHKILFYFILYFIFYFLFFFFFLFQYFFIYWVEAERQSLWTTKMARNGIQVWDSVYNEAITTSPVSVGKCSKIKKTPGHFNSKAFWLLETLHPSLHPAREDVRIYLSQTIRSHMAYHNLRSSQGSSVIRCPLIRWFSANSFQP